MKNFLRKLSPPFLLQFYRALKGFRPIPDTNIWSGNYSSWQEAAQYSTGYDDKVIVEKCKNSLLKVKNGEAIYERDSVLFDEIEYSWPLLAGLQHIALQNNNTLSVVDFGGSFGSTYFQNRFFLSSLKKLNWNIVEQNVFVEEGKKYFEDDILKFFPTIKDSISHSKPDVVILSAVLQYLERPYETLNEIFSLDIPYIIIDKTTFINQPVDILTVQDVPAEIYKARYPSWFFGIENFKAKIKKYEVMNIFNAYEGSIITLESGITASHKGFILKMKHDK